MSRPVGALKSLSLFAALAALASCTEQANLTADPGPAAATSSPAPSAGDPTTPTSGHDHDASLDSCRCIGEIAYDTVDFGGTTTSYADCVASLNDDYAAAVSAMNCADQVCNYHFVTAQPCYSPYPGYWTSYGHMHYTCGEYTCF
jgi:hypothetical protein